MFVEYAPQTRVEGDIQQMPSDFAVTELWEVLSQRHAGRTSVTQVTVFDSVGFALEDFSALRYMRDTALALGMGERMALIPALALMHRHPRGLALMRPTRPLGHLVRGGFGMFAMATSFAAFQYLPAADVVASTPQFVVLRAVRA